MNIKARKLLILATLLVSFALPAPLAYWAYRHPTAWFHQADNRGQLLAAPLPLIQDSKKWGLVLWEPKLCQKDCLSALDTLVHVRLAMGRKFYVIDVWLLQPPNTEQNQTLAPLLQQNDIKIQRVQPDGQNALLESAHIFITNEAGCAILSFPLQAPPQAMYHDLNRLLRTL